MKKTVILFALFAATMCFSKAYSQTSDILTPLVGIGTSAPNADLHIHSAVLHEYGGGHSTDGPRDQIDEGYYLTTLRMTNAETGTGATHGFYLQLMDNEITMRQWEKSWIKILASNESGMIFDSCGRIGIGTDPAAGKVLNVNGNAGFSNDVNVGHSISTVNMNVTGTATIAGNTTIGNGFQCSWDGHVKAKEIIVTLEGWSDNVFDSGYRLMPLGELERYVNANRHLPNIPSATEVETGGVNVGKMDALLLEKIEELTLYIIDLQKQIDELKK